MRLNPKVIDILKTGNREQRLYIFEREPVYFTIYYFSEYFTYAIAEFHEKFYQDIKDIDSGDMDEVAWIAFRESAKTSIAKLSLVIWSICFKKRRFINYSCYDKSNAEAALFDIVVQLQTNNKLISDFGSLYNSSGQTDQDGMKKSSVKRVSNFVTENDIKVEAFSTQESTRGRLYKHYRPDLYIFDDIETSKTKDSFPITHKIIEHLKEAKAGMGVKSAILYLGNYITEEGVISYVMKTTKENPKGVVRFVPVILKGGSIAWEDKYVKTDIEAFEVNKERPKEIPKISLESKKRSLGDVSYAAEMMNDPHSVGELFFNRDIISQKIKEAKPPIKEIAGLKIWYDFDASHTYGMGGDTSEGKGLDANALVIIDYFTTPKKVVATFQDNAITPNVFGHEMIRAGNIYGGCLAIPEINNTGFATMAELQHGGYENIYIREAKHKMTGKLLKEYGFRMTVGNKYDVLGQVKTSVEAGELEILDEDLLKELYYYKKQDMNSMKMVDGMTRHFDKLIALALAWEGRKVHQTSKIKKNKIFYNNQDPYEF